MLRLHAALGEHCLQLRDLIALRAKACVLFDGGSNRCLCNVVTNGAEDLVGNRRKLLECRLVEKGMRVALSAVSDGDILSRRAEATHFLTVELVLDDDARLAVGHATTSPAALAFVCNVVGDGPRSDCRERLVPACA